MSSIRVVPREEIEDKLWNGCVHYAINAMPYGYTWFLDNICESWYGLVMGEYRAVMPIVYEKAWGVEYVYQPYLARSLGLFSLRMPDKKMFKAFVDAIPNKYVDVKTTFSDFGKLSHENYNFQKGEHHLVNLEKTYSEVEANRNVELSALLANKTEASFIKTDVKPEVVVALFKDHLKEEQNQLRDVDFHALHRIIYKAQHYGVGQTVGLYVNNVLVSTLFYIHSRHSILVYLAASEKSTSNGIAILINHLIQTNSGSKKVLDLGQFLGELGENKLPNLFEATPFYYWEMTQKKVPWYLKYIRVNGT